MPLAFDKIPHKLRGKCKASFFPMASQHRSGQGQPTPAQALVASIVRNFLGLLLWVVIQGAGA